MRALMSVAAPAGNGTTTVTLPEGNFWARAIAGAARQAPAVAARTLRLPIMFPRDFIVAEGYARRAGNARASSTYSILRNSFSAMMTPR